jgi:hypothetical protein
LKQTLVPFTVLLREPIQGPARLAVCFLCRLLLDRDPGSGELEPGSDSDSPTASKASERSRKLSARVIRPSRSVKTCPAEIATAGPP